MPQRFPGFRYPRTGVVSVVDVYHDRVNVQVIVGKSVMPHRKGHQG